MAKLGNIGCGVENLALSINGQVTSSTGEKYGIV